MKKRVVKDEAVTEGVINDKPVDSKITHLKNKTKFHLSRLLRTKKRKIIVSIVGFIVLLAILFAIPLTRYGILGLVVRKDVTITVIDSKTKQPVSNALVKIGNVSKQTDKDGVARLTSVPVSQSGIEITKQYYKTADYAYTVPVLFSPASPKLEILATGRQITVNVVNKITGKHLENVVITSSQTKATTNADGTTALILAPAPDTQKATLTKDGYNSQDVTIKVTQGAVANFEMTPAGSIYYLSNATGVVNVMKANLDGTNATVAVQGTGQEVDYQTTLLSTTDWQYSALIATRTDNEQKVYLYNNAKSEFDTIDEGNATFSSVGWSGHNFVYVVYRNTPNTWDDKRQALKTYNADTGKLTTIDETSGAGTSVYDNTYEYFGSEYILNDEVVYTKTWSWGYYQILPADKTASLMVANTTTGAKKLLKSFSNNSVSVKLYEPQSIYIRVTNGSDPSSFYEYQDGAVKTVSGITDNKFDSQYTTYLLSPSGKKTFWYENRDGKNTLFIGDDNAGNEKTIATLSDYIPYGWYGANDEYILLSKGGSELYIASADGTLGTPLKVTDYHSTRLQPGYGSGYGGQ